MSATDSLTRPRRPPLPGSPIKILVVDDDRDVCDQVQKILTAQGFEATSISDPTRTLETLRTQTYHLVILDLIMPGLNGMDLLDDIRRLDDDIAIIIITGFPSVETAVQSLKHAASDYLSKPFDNDDLFNTIQTILRKKGLLTNPEEELLKTIGQRIRQTRKGKSLTLKQMSRRTGLSVSLLSQIERAESAASVSSLFKIATALECRLTELFGSF